MEFSAVSKVNAFLCFFLLEIKMNKEVTIHTLPHLKCIRLASVRSSLPCINIGVRIELTNN